MFEFKVRQRLFRARKFGGKVRARRRFLRRVGFFFDEQPQRFEIVHAAPEFHQRADLGAQRRDFRHLRLRKFLAFPKTRLGHQRFQLAEASLQARQVKDTSADGPRGL